MMIRNIPAAYDLLKCKPIHHYLLMMSVPLLLLAAGCGQNATEQQVRQTDNTRKSVSDLPKQQYMLRDGVVVDLANDIVYVCSTDARVAAVELGTGKTRWRSPVAAKPIEIVGNRLIVHVAPGGKGNALTLAEYRTSDGGQLSTSTLTLPEGVNAYIRNYGKGFLNIRPYKINNESVLTWSYYGGITRGDYDERKENVKKAPAGAYKVGGSPGIFNEMEMSDLPKNYRSNSILVSGEKQIKGKRGRQFYSSNKRHVLLSWKETDDRDFYSYRWQIYDAETKEFLGDHHAHVSYTPFFVKAGVLYQVVGPYLVVDGKERQVIPLQILAVDLKSGKTIWNKPILDTAYRGPTPP